MKKILKVALREYVETVKTKTFIFSILLMPVLIGGIVFLSIRFQTKSMTGDIPDRQVTILNLSDELTKELDNAFTGFNESHPQRKIIAHQQNAGDFNTEEYIEMMKERVRSGDLDAFLTIDSDILDGEGSVLFYTKKITDFDFFSRIRNLVNGAVFNSRFRQHDLSPELIAKLRRRVPIEQIDLSGKEEKKGNELAKFMVPAFFMFLIFFGIITTSQGLLMSVIEEKTSRVIEVLLSSVTPFQLMVGKILGQSAVGFTLVGLYGTASYITATASGLGDILQAGMFVCFVIYFILGFLLIASMLAAIGSVCNTVKESQSLMGPVMIIFMLPMFMWTIIIQQPEGTLSIALSFIPPMTPMIMMLRIASLPDFPVVQFILSIILLAVSVIVTMWLSAKIFRTGILMYGKPPSLRELFRWIRYS